MVFHRAILVASAIFLAPGMSAAALAGCGGCGFEAGPAAYAQPFYPEPAPVYAEPLAIPAPVPPPVAVAPAPLAVDHWDTGGCGTLGGCLGGFGGCGGGFGGCGGGLLGFNGCNCGRSVGYYPSPLYVVESRTGIYRPGADASVRDLRACRGLRSRHQLSLCRSPLRLSWARLLPVWGLSWCAVRLWRARLCPPALLRRAAAFIPLTFCGSATDWRRPASRGPSFFG